MPQRSLLLSLSCLLRSAVAVFGFGLLHVRANALTTYANRVAFDLAAPNQSLETFEEAVQGFGGAQGTFGIMENPLDKTTNNAFFSPGNIVDGLRLTANTIGGVTVPNLAIGSPGFRNGPSHAVGFFFGDTDFPQLTLDFYNGDMNGFGLDLGGFSSGGFEVNVTVTLYSGANSLGSFVVNDVGPSVFFGATSDSGPITRATFGMPLHAGFFSVDNIALATGASAVPDAGTMLPSIALALAILGAVARCQQKQPPLAVGRENGFAPPFRSIRRILGCVAALLVLAPAMRALPIVFGDFSVKVSAAAPSAGSPVVDSQTRTTWATDASAVFATSEAGGGSIQASSGLAYDLVNPDNGSTTFSLSTNASFRDDARTFAELTASFSVSEPVTYSILGTFQGYVNGSTAIVDTLLTAQTNPNPILYRESEGYTAVRLDDAFLFRNNLLDDGNILNRGFAGSPTGILLPGIVYRLDVSYLLTPSGRDSWASGSSNWTLQLDRIGGPGDPPGQNVPDSAHTAALLSSALVGMGLVRRWKAGVKTPAVKSPRASAESRTK